MTQEQLPRFRASTRWVELVIKSEPYVVLSAFGYVPVVRVSEAKSGSEYELIIAPKSLAEPLEALRQNNGGTFKGLTIRLRKQGEERQALYQLTSAPSGDQEAPAETGLEGKTFFEPGPGRTMWWCDSCGRLTVYKEDCVSGGWRCSVCGASPPEIVR